MSLSWSLVIHVCVIDDRIHLCAGTIIGMANLFIEMCSGAIFIEHLLKFAEFM